MVNWLVMSKMMVAGGRWQT